MYKRIASDGLASALILLTSFYIFVSHASYPFLTPEVMAPIAILVAAGILVGILGQITNSVRAALTAGLLVFFIDVQSDIGPKWLLVTGALIFIVCWWLKRRTATILIAVFGSMLVATPFLPQAPRITVNEREAAARSDTQHAPPLLVHLLVDEHIGIEGIPREIEGGAELVDALKSFYLTDGFTLFGNAYSSFAETAYSVSHLFNFLPKRDAGVLRKSPSERFAFELVRSSYLGDLQASGYRLRIYQTDYLDLCSVEHVEVQLCHTYAANSIGSLVGVELPWAGKSRVISSMYLERSSLYLNLRNVYNAAVQNGANPRWPLWNWERTRVGPLPAMELFDQLEAALSKARPGDFIFAHILMPHFPYIYDRNCKLREDPSEWLEDTAYADEMPRFLRRFAQNISRDKLNTSATRASRYRVYFEQITCLNRRLRRLFDVLKASGEYDRSILIIQGDHGSRIRMSSEVSNLSPDRFKDLYSTLFAARLPGVAPGYRQDIVPINMLLGALKSSNFREVRDFDVGSTPGQVYLRPGSSEDFTMLAIPGG